MSEAPTVSYASAPTDDDGRTPLPPGAPLVEVRDLRTHFPIRKGVLARTVGHVKAVDGVSFDIAPGKTLGLVGESGCGKTTVGRTLLRLIPATSGEVRYRGRDFFAYKGEELRRLRRHMQIVFQDPVSSLNPRMTVGSIIGEPIQVHGIANGKEKRDLVASLLARVGLDPSYGLRYPHEFSGGQRQRIGIARALALSPDFIVCDEPVSALDVSIQSQILNLLDDLQRERNIAYLFIAHNLAVVEHFSDEVAVMYLGRIVEKASSRELYANPKHPYTMALLSAVPEPNPRPKRKRIVLKGEVPSPSNPPTGCPFHPRCPLARQAAADANATDTVEITSAGERFRVLAKCKNELPPLEQKEGESGHVAACWVTK
ncbi:MAG: oligopeptide/dipeptide ABC transporter ATP-binding protein [Tepidisphaeraceae bacterium]